MSTIFLLNPSPHDRISYRRVTSPGHFSEQGKRGAGFFIGAPVKLPSCSADVAAPTGAKNLLAVDSALLRYIE